MLVALETEETMRRSFSLTREEYVKYHCGRSHLKISDRLSDAVAYLYTSAKGRPCATVFFGKQSQPVADFQYRDEIEREKSIRVYFERRRAHDKTKAERRAEDKAFIHDAQVGDIYRTCWGYDQTNVEFFEIVEIKGKFAILREIACAVDSSTLGGPQERIVPQSGQYVKSYKFGEEPIRRLIQKHGIKIDDVRHGSKWGTRDPITGTALGRAVSRTGYGWGH